MTDRRVLLRLYVAGQLPNSRRALATLTDFCQRRLRDCHCLEVVDVLADPDRALTDRVLLTPTLVILEPLPMRTLAGDLSEAETLEQALAEDIARDDGGEGGALRR